MVRASTAAYILPALDLRARDEDRDRCIGRLQDAYVEGALTSEELDDRLNEALSARTCRQLNDLTHDLVPASPDARPSGQRRRGNKATVTVAAVALALLGVVGVATAGSSQSPNEAEAVCVFTGLSADIDCPDPTKEQVAIQESTVTAGQAAARAEAAADPAGDTPAARAALRARNAAEQADQAVADAQAIVAAAPHHHPKKAAFSKVIREAERAAAAATKAARQAEDLAHR